MDKKYGIERREKGEGTGKRGEILHSHNLYNRLFLKLFHFISYC
jgi:hypothetical protein